MTRNVLRHTLPPYHEIFSIWIPIILLIQIFSHFWEIIASLIKNAEGLTIMAVLLESPWWIIKLIIYKCPGKRKKKAVLQNKSNIQIDVIINDSKIVLERACDFIKSVDINKISSPHVYKSGGWHQKLLKINGIHVSWTVQYPTYKNKIACKKRSNKICNM